MMNDPIHYAKILAGHIPQGASITGLYENARGEKGALVSLANGREVVISAGTIRRIDTRKVIRKGTRAYEVRFERRTSVPGAVTSVAQGPDDSLVR